VAREQSPAADLELQGHPHHLTIPDHSELRIGTLRKIIGLVASYLEKEPADVIRELFER
jgi:hypothetical protein